MKLKCISGKLNPDQLYILGKNASPQNHFHISIGKEYTVFGLTFRYGSQSTGCFVQIISDYNHIIDVPILLFEITDGRCSKFWEIKVFQNGYIALWPSSFYRELYHDNLFEDVKDIVEDFKNIKQMILTEFE